MRSWCWGLVIVVAVALPARSQTWSSRWWPSEGLSIGAGLRIAETTSEALVGVWGLDSPRLAVSKHERGGQLAWSRSLDLPPSDDGWLATYGTPTALPDDGVVIATTYSTWEGSFEVSQGLLLRLDPDGILSWAVLLPARTSVGSVAITASGRILVTVQRAGHDLLMLLDGDGAVAWTRVMTAGSAVQTSLRQLAVTPDGRMFLSGHGESGSHRTPFVCRLNEDGSIFRVKKVEGIVDYRNNVGAGLAALADGTLLVSLRSNPRALIRIDPWGALIGKVLALDLDSGSSLRLRPGASGSVAILRQFDSGLTVLDQDANAFSGVRAVSRTHFRWPMVRWR